MQYVRQEIAKTTELFATQLDTSTPINISPLAGEGCNITFKDVSFSITLPDRERKPILESVSGHFEAGNLVAVMGPSGCGKSTLLDMLANKKTASYEGKILVNGNERDHLFQRIAAYVGQEDVMPQHWTVKEAIAFNSALKVDPPKNVPREIVDARLELILAAFGLGSVRDTYLGGPKVRGCSGGQRRRVTLARGVVQGARILFLDEPTSGLSATDAQLCIKSLRIMAQRLNLLILVVIHQPRIEVAKLFDHLLLLTANPGRVCYNGLMRDAVGYFDAVGFPVPEFSNPTDHFLDLCTPGYEREQVETFASHYEKETKPGIIKIVEEAWNAPGMKAIDLFKKEREKWLMWGKISEVKSSKYGI